jgi:hypothetical protein
VLAVTWTGIPFIRDEVRILRDSGRGQGQDAQHTDEDQEALHHWTDENYCGRRTGLSSRFSVRSASVIASSTPWAGTSNFANQRSALSISLR